MRRADLHNTKCDKVKNNHVLFVVQHGNSILSETKMVGKKRFNFHHWLERISLIIPAFYQKICSANFRLSEQSQFKVQTKVFFSLLKLSLNEESYFLFYYNTGMCIGTFLVSELTFSKPYAHPSSLLVIFVNENIKMLLLTQLHRHAWVTPSFVCTILHCPVLSMCSLWKSILQVLSWLVWPWKHNVVFFIFAAKWIHQYHVSSPTNSMHYMLC